MPPRCCGTRAIRGRRPEEDECEIFAPGRAAHDYVLTHGRSVREVMTSEVISTSADANTPGVKGVHDRLIWVEPVSGAVIEMPQE
jgi:hypothetical protein